MTGGSAELPVKIEAKRTMETPMSKRIDGSFLWLFACVVITLVGIYLGGVL